MTQQDDVVNEDDLTTRRALASLRRGAPLALGLALLAGLAVYLLSAGDPSTFESEGALELTDEIASGIDVRSSRRDALVEIEAQLLRLGSDDFRGLVEDALGESADELLTFKVSNRETTPVLVITATARSAAVAEQTIDAAMDTFITVRTADLAVTVDLELGPLRTQREDQLAIIDGLAAELEEKRGVAPQDQISILEQRTGAALRRLEQYDVAIQEREFIAQTSTGQLRIVNQATDATEIPSGALTRAIQIAALVLVLSLIAAIILGRVRGKLVMLDEVRAVAGANVPILATVPKFPARHRKGPTALVVGRRDTSREAESFRYMRTSIEVATEGLRPMIIAFTSAGPNEGKTVTSANYALAMAGAAHQTAILDGDLLNSSTGNLFGASGTNAFVELLNGQVDPATQEWHRIPTSRADLELLNMGHAKVSRSRQELSPPEVEAMFGKLAQLWDVVVVDCPPVLAVSDSMVLARAADVTVLIVRMGRTSKRDLSKAMTHLKQNRVNLAGIVVTHSTGKAESYYGYGYGYGYDEAAGE